MMNSAMPLATPATDRTDRLATEAQRAFGRRVRAAVQDILVVSLLSFIINSVFGVTHVTGGSAAPPAGGGATHFTSSTDVGWGWLAVVWLVYFFGLEALFGATVGKWVCGLRVTDREGRRPALWQIVVRNLLRVVDALPVGYLIGGGAAALSPWRQRLGDLWANTVVLPREAATAPQLPPVARRWRQALVGAVLVAFLGFSLAFSYYGRPPLVVQGLMNTRAMMFSDGVRSYQLSAPDWGNGTVTYQIEYVTEHPVHTCRATLTLAWTFPNGWEPSYGESPCLTP